MRKAVHGIVGKAHAEEELCGMSETVGAREVRLVNRQRLGDDFTHAHARIQGSERVLENHLHLPALGTQGCSGKRQQIAAFEKNCSVIGFDQAQKKARERGFATAALANDGQGSAGFDEETYVVYGNESFPFCFLGEESATAPVALAKTANFEQMPHSRTQRAE